MSENIVCVERFLGRISRGDVQEALHCLGPSVELLEPDSLPYGGRYTGREGFVRFLTEIAKFWDIAPVATLVHDLGDDVLVRSALRLTARSTDRTLDTSVLEVYSVERGLITRIEPFFRDTAKMVGVLDELQARGEGPRG